VPPQRGRRKGKGGNNGDADRNRRPQLPPRGGPRAELPGGSPQPRVPSWSDENAQPPAPRASLDAPRGHEEPDARMPRVDDRQGPGSTAEIPAVGRFDERQGPGATAEFARPDFDAPPPGADQARQQGGFPAPDRNGAAPADQFGRPRHDDPYAQGDQQHNDPFAQGDQRRDDRFAHGGQDGARFDGAYGQDPFANNGDQYGQQGRDGGQDSGQFVRPDVFGTGAASGGPAATGQFPAPQGYDDGSTGRHTMPDRQGPSATGQFERPQQGGGYGGNDFGAPRQRPVRPEPEALPPASGPGDGRTPLYDTLETNWFRGEHREAQGNGPAAAPEQPGTPAAPQPAAPQRPTATSWRSSPNDDLVRQAERVRQPAAGGVTTSGLPRRVPRANLVPGTAQQQSHQSGPQVSRAPDDVRGRLTNLRRGIAQGRQAGTNQTGSFPRPTHQQER
jgi:hypothetical protein